MSTPHDPDRAALNEHISQITTCWTALFQAQGRKDDNAAAAQEQLLQRYSAPIYRYLLGAVRDRDAADELFQEFALRFVRGDFRGANPERGRFRAFLKTTLFHLVVDHQRKGRSASIPLSRAGCEPAAETSPPESDQDFTHLCRKEALARAWELLADWEKRTGQPLHTVLRLRTDQPDLESSRMAEKLSAALGEPVTAGWVRKRLHVARAKYTDFLLNEIAQTLENATAAALADELRDLELLDYCKSALDRFSAIRE